VKNKDKHHNSVSNQDNKAISPNIAIKSVILSQSEEQKLLAELPEWEIIESEAEGGKVKRQLHRRYEFKSFEAAFEFMSQSAKRAIEKEDHHPIWQNTYNRVEIWLTTFDLGNQISNRDIRLAKAFEEIWSERNKDF